VAPDIVQEAFAEWTKGLSGRDARISIFDHIRDIPYAVIPEISNPVDGPQGLLKGMKGSCTPKHFLLGRMFEMLQIPIKRRHLSIFMERRVRGVSSGTEEVGGSCPC
jgi:hypothetical protein